MGHERLSPVALHTFFGEDGSYIAREGDFLRGLRRSGQAAPDPQKYRPTESRQERALLRIGLAGVYQTEKSLVKVSPFFSIAYLDSAKPAVIMFRDHAVKELSTQPNKISLMAL